MKLEITETEAKALYPKATTAIKDKLISVFGKELFIKPAPTNRPASFEIACKTKGLDAKKLIAEWKKQNLSPRQIALCQLETIIEVVNGDWKVDLNNNNQYRYYPYFDTSSGGFSFFGYYSTHSGTNVGVRLFVSSSADAIWLGKTYLELYRILYTT